MLSTCLLPHVMVPRHHEKGDVKFVSLIWTWEQGSRLQPNSQKLSMDQMDHVEIRIMFPLPIMNDYESG